MKNYIKHHINVILLALRVIIVGAGAVVLYSFGSAALFIINNDPAQIKQQFSGTFTPLVEQSYHNNVWYASIFVILFGILLIYLIFGIVRFYKCLLRIEKGKMFYSTQGEDFRKAGSAIIIFAKLKYLLFCTMGGVVYFQITIFFTELLPFLGVYLIGKLILLMSYMAEKGEFIQEENELTI